MSLASKIARLHFARDYFEMGDFIYYGKYLNKKGRIVGWGTNEKGDPTVEIEPIPKGRKQNKVLKLFKIRRWKKHEASIIIAKGRFKEKKKVPSKDGGETTVYVYGPRQISNRNRAKAERIEKLRKNIGNLRKKVKEDLKSSDEKTKAIALAIALMDHTYERVGNEDSASNGHFGVTGWKLEHITFKGNKAFLKYVGKSGVEQTKEVTERPLVKALKDTCDGKDPDDCIIDAEATEVNKYLKDFDITAKDIRGLHANEEMKVRLRQIRKKGPSLPKGRKEKDKILKEEFKKALEETAKAVGHEASTLRKQYLVPGLEDDFMKDGTINQSHSKKASSPWEAVEVDPWGDKIYYMDVRKDRFIHFTLRDRAEQILKSGRLLLDPPYSSSGAYAVHAISLTYGQTSFGVVWKHLKKISKGPGDIVGIVFKTNKPPKKGFVEEVIWNEDVPLQEAKIIPGNRGLIKTRRAPHRISDQDVVLYEKPPSKTASWNPSGLKSKYKLDKLHAHWDPTIPHLSINVISVDPKFRGQGNAQMAMEHIIRWADKNNVILTLTPSSDFGASKSRLTKWYKSLGFKPNKGRNKDYRFQDSMIRVGTKSKSEKEDEQVQKMLRKEPKKKPPRYDLRNNRTLEEDDEDLKGLSGDSDGDRDLTLNYKRVAFRWFLAKAEPPVMVMKGKDPVFLDPKKVKELAKKIKEEYEKKHPDTKRDEKSYMEEAQKKLEETSGEKEEEKPKGLPTKKKKTDPVISDDAKEPSDEEVQDGEVEDEETPEDKQEEVEKIVKRAIETTQKLIGEDSNIPDDVQESLRVALGNLQGEDREQFAQTMERTLEDHIASDAGSKRMQELANETINFEGYDGIEDPEELGERIANLTFTRDVVANPLIVGGQQVSEEIMDNQDLRARGMAAFEHFQGTDEKIQQLAAKKALKALEGIDPESNRAKEINTLLSGVALSSIIDQGKSIEGRPEASEGFVAVARALNKHGDSEVLLESVEDFLKPESLDKLESGLRNVGDHELVEALIGDNSENPYAEMGEFIKDAKVREPYHSLVRDALIRLNLDDMSWGDRLVRDRMKESGTEGWDNPAKRHEIQQEIKAENKEGKKLTQAYLECLEEAQMGKKDRTECDDMLKDENQVALRAQNANHLLQETQKRFGEATGSSSEAILKNFVDRGDASLLRSTVEPHPEDFSGEGKRFSSYKTSFISAGLYSQREISMANKEAKLSKKAALDLTSRLDKIASDLEKYQGQLGIKPRIADDMALRCDLLSDHIERHFGINRQAEEVEVEVENNGDDSEDSEEEEKEGSKKKAQMDPKENFTEEKLEPGEYNPAEIGEEQADAFLRNSDEPYMDVFKQDEFDQLREVQQTGQFSNAKAAAALVSKIQKINQILGLAK